METIGRDRHVEIKTWAPWGEIEESAQKQLRNASNLRVVWPWVAVMSDVHAGMGSTIGSVIPTRGALIPAAVGVDIGCGMMALRTNLCMDDIGDFPLSVLRHEIEAEIPHGVGMAYRTPAHDMDDYWHWFDAGYNGIHADLPGDYYSVASRQCGTLGSGNHFIELSVDEEGAVWVVIHSGSRGLGNKIAMHHIRLAKKSCEWLELPDTALSFFKEGTDAFAAYWDDLRFAQAYAKINRTIMMRRVLDTLDRHFSPGVVEVIDCHHNYAAEEFHLGKRLFVTRKGAIRAETGDRGIIPGSMGDRSYIVTGLGNKEALASAPHGAGRKMSRSKAKKTFSLIDVESQTAGVECRKDSGILDELPGAYKRIDQVMEQAKTLVHVDHVLKQFVNIKG